MRILIECLDDLGLDYTIISDGFNAEFDIEGYDIKLSFDLLDKTIYINGKSADYDKESIMDTLLLNMQ